MSACCLVGFIHSCLTVEALFSSPGAFVHSEIEVSSHCVCNTGNLKQNITSLCVCCCFIVSLLALVLFLPSLHCQTGQNICAEFLLLVSCSTDLARASNRRREAPKSLFSFFDPSLANVIGTCTYRGVTCCRTCSHTSAA